MRTLAHVGAGGVANPGRKQSWWRALFDLPDREATFAVRGFRAGDAERQLRLEQIGLTFIRGYREGLYSGRSGPDPAFLNAVPGELRGFLAEGMAMGCAIADVVGAGSGRLAAWIAATETSFSYLAHVGAGWALARVPFARRAILAPLDPIHRWLAFDGLGFHDTYFQPERVLAGWRRVRNGYEPAAYDQGVGRALWFLGCADPRWAATTIEEFDADRRADLWAGLGLAIAYAGGADAADLEVVRTLAGPHRPDLAQGAAFAAAAREQAGFSPGPTISAAQALTGLAPGVVADLVGRVRAALPPRETAEAPRYELWRAGVRRALQEHGAES